ncbi:MAG TPA: hypothetical protein DCG69_00555 [Bacteroidales bacterium]|nr:hypothetical protein [Bacteroidales bacterium]
MNTHDLIIQNSFVLFLRHGVKEISINEIIKSCGLSKGAFYHHFESKEKVYMDVLDRFFFSYFQKQNVYYSSEILIDEKLDRFINSFLSPYQEIADLLKEDQLTSYFRFLFQAAATYPDIRIRVNKHFYRKGYYLYQIIETGKETGEIRPAVDAELAARQLMNIIIGVTILEGINTMEALKKQIRLVIFDYYSLIKETQ